MKSGRGVDPNKNDSPASLVPCSLARASRHGTKEHPAWKCNSGGRGRKLEGGGTSS